MDIDVDLAPSKKPNILQKMRDKKGELNVLQIATFGTEGTKSAVLTACRGYRSEDYPEGIDVDEGQYMTSLIPSHRGFLWPLKDVIEGNPSENRGKVHAFIKEVDKYPGLLDIMTSIEGLINKRSSHAAGVVLYNKTPFDTTGIMRTPSGELITSYSLHDAEYAGDVKYDFLVTEISDKIITCLEFLSEEDKIESGLTLREQYNKYLHPQVLPLDKVEMWNSLGRGATLDVFQFNSATGLQAAKMIKPQNALEMTAANALMRLMGEQGQETPMERYTRMKNDISLWYKEMRDLYKLTEEDIKILEPYYKHMYGTPCFQEDMMMILMDANLGGFSLTEANNARKIVGKKQMSKIPQLKKQVFEQAKTQRIGQYIWDTCVAPQLGYAFSILHSLAYSFVGLQTLYLDTQFSSVYWNTACLTVNAGSLDNEDEDSKSTDYGKIASAIGDIMTAGASVSLPDINTAKFGFTPNVKLNSIVFGLKGVNKVGDDLVRTIIANRPYSSLKDFMDRVSINKQAMVSLIKGGAFDAIENRDRREIMASYIWATCAKKETLNMRNFNALLESGLLDESLEDQAIAFRFNKFLSANCGYNAEYFSLPEGAVKYIELKHDLEMLEYQDGLMLLNKKVWKKKYDKVMNVARQWIKDNLDSLLVKFNNHQFALDWHKYAKGTVATWEMESLCFYYGEHELAKANIHMYGISEFNNLPEEPEVDYTFRKNGRDIPIFKLTKIIGTCIDKNKTKSTVTLLTTSGVVQVKFRAEFFSIFDKQLSERQEDGTKKIMEKSWFGRGNMVMITGYRRGDQFVPKKYSKTPGHQLYKITEVSNDGQIKITNLRYGTEVA